MYQDKQLFPLFPRTNFCITFCLSYLSEIFLLSGGKVSMAHAAQGSMQFALHGGDAAMTRVWQCRLNAELVSEK
jgi:hypothetical protein